MRWGTERLSVGYYWSRPYFLQYGLYCCVLWSSKCTVILRQIIGYGLSHIFHLFHFTLYGGLHSYHIKDLRTEQILLPWQKRGKYVDVCAINTIQTKQAQNTSVSGSRKTVIVFINKPIAISIFILWNLPSSEWVIHDPSASYLYVFTHIYRVYNDEFL